MGCALRDDRGDVGSLSLSAVVQHLLTHHRDLLSVNRRVQEQTLSDNNSAYNKARQRLPLKIVEAIVDAVCNQLAQRSEAAQAERIIDRPPNKAMVLADSTFGIFGVADHCQSLGKEFVFRLTSDAKGCVT